MSVVPVLLALLMAGAAAGAWWGPRRWAPAWCAQLVLLAGLWLVLDKHFEGPVLLPLGGGHGVVLADLVALGALAVAGLGAVRVLAAGSLDREV